MTDEVRFKIAEAARMTGVSASTLRLWESQGLIKPERSDSGQRHYGQAHIDRLKKIIWLRNEKGLNPAAIRETLESQADSRGKKKGHAAGEDDQAVGPKIRQLRRDAQETLEQVSQATAIPVSLLSMFERTSQGLSLKSLHDLVSHFGVTLSNLADRKESQSRESLVRRGKWLTWPKTSTGVSVQVLAEGNNQMTCHRFVLAPGASSEGAYAHEGEEFIHVLSGSMEIVLDHKRFFTLDEGDSLYFESNRPHSWRNVSDGETVLIWVNTPPTF